MGQHAEKRGKTERVTGLGRKTTEEIVKWNQMTALRFQAGGRQQTSLASLRRGNNGNESLVPLPPQSLTLEVSKPE